MFKEREGWQSELKEGDLVIYVRGWQHYDELLTVKKVTPSGIVKTTDGLSFRPTGYATGNTSGRIVEATDERVQAIHAIREKREILWKIGSIKMSSLSLEQLRQIAEIIDGGEK